MSLDPENVNALIDMGNVCFKLFDYVTALKLFKKVFVLNPDNELIAVCIANALTLMKDKNKLIRTMKSIDND